MQNEGLKIEKEEDAQNNTARCGAGDDRKAFSCALRTLALVYNCWDGGIDGQNP